MRASLWQQFSSNHSAHFILVGAFESAEYAALVADELRQIIRTLHDWYADPANEDYVKSGRPLARRKSASPPPDLALAERYQLSEPRAVDWLVPLDHPEDEVRIFEQLVFLSPPNNTWTGVWPFDQLMQKLGGEVFLEQEDRDGYVRTTVRWAAPDEASAVRIEQELRMPKAQASKLEIPRLRRPALRIAREGARFELRSYLWDELPQLLRYLRERGCLEISCTFERTPR